MSLGGAWFALGFTVVPVLWAGGFTTERMARQWACDRGALVDGVALDVLHRQLILARVGRVLSVAGALSAGMMVTAYRNAHSEEPPAWWDAWMAFSSVSGPWAAAATGYVVASCLVEVSKPRWHDDQAPIAVLDRRRLADVLDLGVVRCLRLYGIAASIATLAWLAVLFDSGSVRPSAWALSILGTGLGAVAAAAWVARRRQRARGDDELAVDELTRTATANAVAGAAVATFGLYVFQVVQSAVSELVPVATGALIVFTIFGLGVWWASGTTFVFRTRRIDALRAAA
jgi:hypothetical protein